MVSDGPLIFHWDLTGVSLRPQGLAGVSLGSCWGFAGGSLGTRWGLVGGSLGAGWGLAGGSLDIEGSGNRHQCGPQTTDCNAKVSFRLHGSIVFIVYPTILLGRTSTSLWSTYG